MTSVTGYPRTSYDLVPYESFPFPLSHPDRLATLGRLFGLDTPDLATCRVLELGCASGGNLIPLAVAMPGGEFVGIDLSTVEVAQGQEAIEGLGLTNVRLQAMDIHAIDQSLGQFDYIICHGVYSWVPDVVQEKILAICAEQLRPDGIAYISYNTLPGWRMRGMIRDAMRYHAMQFSDPFQRVTQARAILDFLAKWVPAENNPYGMLLKSELDVLCKAADHYILHEHLEDINEPVYFHEFVDRASRHGLQYLAEADFSTMLAASLPREVHRTLMAIAPDVIRQEQLMDFLRNRTFRQTLLVHDDRAVNRSLTPERVKSLWISAALSPASTEPDLATRREESFYGMKGGSIITPNPITKAAMLILARRWPATIAFPDLLRMAMDMLPGDSEQGRTYAREAEAILASDILQCFVVGVLELHAQSSPCANAAGTYPTASPLARWQAARRWPQITTLRHELVQIDAGTGALLQLLDGTRDRMEIYRMVANRSLFGSSAADGAEPSQRLRDTVDQALSAMAYSAVLLN